MTRLEREKLRRDSLFYSANLIGVTVLFYLMLRMLLQAALAALLGANLAGSGTANPAGIPVAAAMALNCAATLVSLGLPLLLLRGGSRPLCLPPLRLAPPTPKAAAYGLPLFLCFTMAASAMTGLLKTALGAAGYTPPPALHLPGGSGAMALAFLAYCVLPAVLEELLFRGGIQRLLAPYGDWFAIFVTSLLFALVHTDLTQLPSVFLLSLLLGYTLAATKNLADAMLLHFANNLSGFVLLWAQQRLDGTNAMALTAVLFALYFGGGILALVLLLRRGGFLRLPRWPARKNQMTRAERVLSAPFFTFALLILVLILILEALR